MDQKHFMEPKFFLGSKISFFWPKFYFWQKKFIFIKNNFYPKFLDFKPILDKILAKLNTWDLSLVLIFKLGLKIITLSFSENVFIEKKRFIFFIFNVIISITFLLSGQCWWFTKIGRCNYRDKVKLLNFKNKIYLFDSP